MKVGRSALDEDAIRSIEERNPDVEFDWTRILKGGPDPVPPPPAPTPNRRPDQDRRAARRAAESRGPRGMEEAPAPLEAATSVAPRAPRGETPLPDPPPLDVRRADSTPLPEMDEGPVTAAHGRLGSEGVLRLRARYAEMLARISERVPDEPRREELKADAERLNPDTWVTDAEVTAGLEGYEAVLESLRGVVGQGRRRRRGAPPTGAGLPPDGPPAPDQAGRHEPPEETDAHVAPQDRDAEPV